MKTNYKNAAEGKGMDVVDIVVTSVGAMIRYRTCRGNLTYWMAPYETRHE